MADELEYAITGALLKCSEGTVPMFFQASPRRVRIQGLKVGNASDKIPITNIPSFVICQKLTKAAGGVPVPCVPVPQTWQKTYPVKINRQEALLFRSTIRCSSGQGKIEFMTSGQLPMPPATSQQLAEMQQEAKEVLEEAQAEANSVGESGFVEGMIPIWGSGRDLIHAAQTGDGWGMALNAGFSVWDVASVAAGLVSFGTATVAMQGAKGGVRGLIKAGGKVLSKGLSRKSAAMLAKAAALKAGLREGKLVFGKSAICLVKACFVGGTPVAVENDYKAIEEIGVGDEVWSYDETSGRLALKPVVAVSENKVSSLVHVRVGGDRLQTTGEHPFLTGRGWVVAGELVVGDEVRRSDGQWVEVSRVEVEEHLAVPVRVYNIEVADWHTYLVGKWLWVVHNATVCVYQILQVVKKFKIKKFRIGKIDLVLDNKGLKHILERHHPDYWNGKAKVLKPFFLRERQSKILPTELPKCYLKIEMRSPKFPLGKKALVK